MHTLGTHFTELLSNIRPPQERLDAARDLPPKVRQFLKEHNEFVTLDPHTRLVGSYAQHTSVGDVKDVDFLVRVPGNPDKNEPEAKYLVTELKQTLDDLPDAIGYSGYSSIEDIEIERARRSVHVYFQGEDFHVDVVPCITPDGFNEMIYVPDRGFNKWIPSHPVGLIYLLKEMDDEHGGKVRPLIKLVKHFRNIHMIYRKPKSYWLGALVIHLVNKEEGLDTSKSLAELFRDFCDATYQQYDHLLNVSDSATPNIPDPMLSHNISWNWERTHFETFMRRLDDGRNWASKALEAKEREEAVGLWQKVFGEEYFPAGVDEKATKLAASVLPGSSFVSSSGKVNPVKPSTGISTPIPKTTFHGET